MNILKCTLENKNKPKQKEKIIMYTNKKNKIQKSFYNEYFKMHFGSNKTKTNENKN